MNIPSEGAFYHDAVVLSLRRALFEFETAQAENRNINKIDSLGRRVYELTSILQELDRSHAGSHER